MQRRVKQRRCFEGNGMMRRCFEGSERMSSVMGLRKQQNFGCNWRPPTLGPTASQALPPQPN